MKLTVLSISLILLIVYPTIGQDIRYFKLDELDIKTRETIKKEYKNYLFSPDDLNKSTRIDEKIKCLREIQLFFKSVYNRDKDIIESFNNLKASHDLFIQKQDTIGILATFYGFCRLNLTNYTISLGNLEQARNYAENAVVLADELNDPIHQILSRSFLSLYYYSVQPRNLKKYEEIENQRLEIAKKNLPRDNPLWATILINQGGIALDKGDFKETKRYSLLALDYYQGQFRNKKMKMIGLTNLGIAYSELGDQTLALQSFEQILQETREDTISVERMNAYENLSYLLYHYIKDFKKSKEYLDSAYFLQTTIFNSNQTKLINELDKKYENAKIKQANLVLKKENEFIQQRFIFLIVLAIFLALVIIFILYVYQKRKGYINQLENLLQKNEQLENDRRFIWTIIAHDLRQPVNSMLGIGRLLKDYSHENDLKKINKFGGLLEQTVVGLQMNLENVLNYSNLKSQYHQYNPRHLKLRDEFQSILTIYRGYELFEVASFDIEGPLETQIWVDSISLQFIIRNLIDNGIKSQPNNSKRIKILVSQPDSQWVSLAIQDYGQGMEKDKLDEINAYFKEERSEDPGTFPNFGIGLYVVKQQAVKNKIHIKYERNQHTQGMIVRLLIPTENSKS